MKTTAIIAAAVMAAVPATAAAQPGQGKGPGSHGQGVKHRSQGEGKTGKRCARPQRVGFVARGTFVSFSDDSLVIKVERANHHARAYTSGTPLSTKGAKVTFSGLGSFAEAVSTDRVMVIGKLVRPKRGCTGETSVVLRKVKVVRPAAAGDETEAPDQD